MPDPSHRPYGDQVLVFGAYHVGNHEHRVDTKAIADLKAYAKAQGFTVELTYTHGCMVDPEKVAATYNPAKAFDWSRRLDLP